MSAKVPMLPREPSLASHQICSQIFGDSPLKLDQTEFKYSTRNDYGKKIDKLLFCKPKEGFSNHFFENMKEIGAIEGFKVVASNSSHFIRHPKLFAADGVILEPTSSEALTIAIKRCEGRSKYLKNHASVLTEHPSIKGTKIGVVALEKMQKTASEGIGKSKQRNSRLYFEGSNCLHLTNQTGIPQYVIGEDLSIITHQALREETWFNREKKPDTVFLEGMLFSQYKDKITSQYLSGEIPKKIEERALRYSNQLSEDEVKECLRELENMGLACFKYDTVEEKKKERERVSKYLAQLAFVKEELFPSELRCQPDQVIFSPQIATYIDTAMAPGPKGSIFLQDYKLSVQLLNSIAAKSQELDLSEQDLTQLQSFIKTTLLVGEDLRPILEQAKKCLEGAGHPVIPTPAVFYSYRSGKPFNINFLNSITGYSDKTGHFFTIAPGVTTDGKLGDVLMDFYVEFRRSQCNNTQVYFVGRNPKNKRDFTEAVEATNRQDSQFGPRTLSFELKTSPHTTKTT